jgi:deoxyadenosine/deoxycytidine kinase
MIVSIAGNIGSGKSTLLRHLHAREYKVLLEGINRNRWNGLLSKYYNDPKKYSFLFQTVVLMDMHKEWRNFARGSPDVIFTERSCVDTMAFSQLIHSEENMNDDELSAFKDLYTMLGTAPDLIINLHVPPEICYDRIRYRDREGEDKITLNYLKKFEKISLKTAKESGIKCLEISAENLTPSELASRTLRLIREAI